MVLVTLPDRCQHRWSAHGTSHYKLNGDAAKGVIAPLLFEKQIKFLTKKITKNK